MEFFILNKYDNKIHFLKKFMNNKQYIKSIDNYISIKLINKLTKIFKMKLPKQNQLNESISIPGYNATVY